MATVTYTPIKDNGNGPLADAQLDEDYTVTELPTYRPLPVEEQPKSGQQQGVPMWFVVVAVVVVGVAVWFGVKKLTS